MRWRGLVPSGGVDIPIAREPSLCRTVAALVDPPGFAGRPALPRVAGVSSGWSPSAATTQCL